MIKHYQLIIKALAYYTTKSLKPLSLVVLLFLLSGVAVSAQGRGKSKKWNQNKEKDISLFTCREDLGDGMYRLHFGYNNPNDSEVVVNQNHSFVYLKVGKYGKRSNNRVQKIQVLNTFQPGIVEDAFTMDISAKGFAKWTVVNKRRKNLKITGSKKSETCKEEEPGVIFPLYDQGPGKSDTPLGLELTALQEGKAGDEPTRIIYQINSNEEVLVEIIPTQGNLQQAINILSGTFGLQYNSNPMVSNFLIDPAMILQEGLAAIDVFFPISRLTELNDHADVFNFIRPLYNPVRNIGIVDSQGDSAQYTDLVRASFQAEVDGERVPVNGLGIKIGVISDSYDKQPFTGKTKATVDVENGDLPGAGNLNGNLIPVDVIMDYPYGVASDEGRAMLHIIHDVAPGAELAFTTGVLSPRDMAMGITNLANAGCDVMVDDITYPLAPFFGDNEISDAIQSFVSQPGKSYITTSGNFANNGYQNVFTATGSVPVTNFIPAGSDTRAHLYDPLTQDYTQKIQVEAGIYMIVLQWDEEMASQENSTGAVTDLDIYLVNDAGDLIVGNNRPNEFGDPTEVLVFQATAQGEANIMITSANGPPPPGLAFRYIAFRSDGLQFMEYGSGAPTVSGHAMAEAAITVGAVDYRVVGSPAVEQFSSYAGLLSNDDLTMVDLVAPDGVNTNVGSIGTDIEPDGFPNFFGTSAAAPHAAGAIALLLSAVPSWYPAGLSDIISVDSPVSNTLSDEVLQLLKDTAVPAGAINRAGAGLIDAGAAFTMIAAQTAHLTGLTVEAGKTPSEEPFEVTITGDYLPAVPRVLFDGEELEIASQTATEIKALVGEFTGNPPLVVYTAPITPGGTDGGDSNPLFFFDGDKIALSIRADDVTAEFGQAISFTYTVEGLPEGETYESLGLPEVEFSTPAVFPYPDVNNYVVTPGFGDDALTPEQMEAFQINFQPGRLTVTKKDLLIRPLEATYHYGDAITLSLEYVYDDEDIADNPDFLNTIQTAHNSDFFPENTLIVINKLRAVVNELDILNLLNNGSWMASERVIQNKLRPIVNGMNLIDLDVQHFDDYLAAQTDPVTNKLRAVVNKLRAVVNGQDLLNNSIDLVFENKLRPVVNDTGLGDENDGNEYNSVFAVIDLEDSSTDTEERTIDKLYAMNLITGLEVSGGAEEWPISFPGAFLAPIASNFNITYDSGTVEILPAPIKVSTGDLVIYKGDPIDTGLIETEIDGLVYEDTLESLFPDGIPYRFEDEQGNEYEDGDVGEFLIKIDIPPNYTLGEEKFGKLTVKFEPFTCENLPELDFSAIPVLESGNPLQKGALYRFRNVTEHADALVSIQATVNGRIAMLDRNNVDPEFFKPEIVYTTTGSIRNPYVEFRVTLVASGTNSPMVFDELIASFIDIDGNNSYREYNAFDRPSRYIVDDPKDISVGESVSEIVITGGATEYNGIFNSNPQVNISAGYTNIASFVFKFGIVAVNSNNFTTPQRQSGIQFSCLDNFVKPQTTIFDAEGDLSGKTVISEGVIYPNPVKDILNIRLEVPGETRITIFDMMGQTYYNATDNGNGQTVALDLTGYPEGILFVRIKNSEGSHVYTIVRDN